MSAKNIKIDYIHHFKIVGVLETELESAISINIPKSMFSDDDNFINARLTAVSFRQMFIQEVWNSKLKNVIQKTIERAKNELKNEEISLVLLSGGSSNIKWINKLFKKDFSHELNTVEIFDLPDYQEVVSKGLAIECARRFYNEEKEGDFSSVTYNRICLLLAPNDFPCEPKVFKPKGSVKNRMILWVLIVTIIALIKTSHY